MHLRRETSYLSGLAAWPAYTSCFMHAGLGYILPVLHYRLGSLQLLALLSSRAFFVCSCTTTAFVFYRESPSHIVRLYLLLRPESSHPFISTKLQTTYLVHTGILGIVSSHSFHIVDVFWHQCNVHDEITLILMDGRNKSKYNSFINTSKSVYLIHTPS